MRDTFRCMDAPVRSRGVRGVLDFPHNAEGIQTSGRPHMSTLYRSSFSPSRGGLLLLFCLRHIGRFRVFGAHRKRAREQSLTQISLPTTQGPQHPITMPENRPTEGGWGGRRPPHQGHGARDTSLCSLRAKCTQGPCQHKPIRGPPFHV